MTPEAESLIAFIDTVEDVLSKTAPGTPVSKIISQIRGPLLEMREQLEALETEGGLFEAQLQIAKLKDQNKSLSDECEEWVDWIESANAEIKRLRANQKDSTE